MKAATVSATSGRKQIAVPVQAVDPQQLILLDDAGQMVGQGRPALNVQSPQFPLPRKAGCKA
jgi:hypothetical protein